MTINFEDAKNVIIAAGNRLDQMGLAPATAGNYSQKLNDDSIAVTVSGKHKGRLGRGDIMRVDLDTKPLEDQRPSAETLLHTSLYKLLPDVNAILHTHSIASTVLSMQKNGHITLKGYELLKAFSGIDTHEVSVTVPVFDNTQDMNVLAPQVEDYLKAHPHTPAYIIRGHGIYGWGRDIAEAERVIEALEFLLACELEVLKLERAGLKADTLKGGISS